MSPVCHCSPSNVIDATRKGNNARYMKHASNANCQSQKWVVDNQLRAYMIALRDIAPGEELTFDCYRQCSLGTHVRSDIDANPKTLPCFSMPLHHQFQAAHWTHEKVQH